MSPRLLMLAALATVSSSVSALEVIGEAPYLENRYRAVWRSTPLATVLKEVEKQAVPLTLSDGVISLGDSRLITLVDNAKVRLRDTLELLERTQDLHFTAEALLLRVETWEDFRDRKRRPVNLALRDYGLFVAADDFPAPLLGYALRTSDHDRRMTFSQLKQDEHQHRAGRGPDPEAVVEWLKDVTTTDDLALRGKANVHLLVTDEEEAAVRAALEDIQSRTLSRSSWRVTFGTLAAGETLPTGLVLAVDATALLPRLKEVQTVTLSALNDQLVHAVAGRQQSQINDLDIVSQQFDPTSDVLHTGRSAELRPLAGNEFTRLTYQLAWVDPLPGVTTTMVNPTREKAGASTVTSTTNERKESHATVTTQDGGVVRPGVALQITKPALWTWQPQGDVLLAKDRALILVTAHPAGSAVMVVEALP